MHEATTAVIMAATQQGPATPAQLPTTATERWSPWRLMPLLGPVGLFVIWDFVVRFKLIPPVLLPSPWVLYSQGWPVAVCQVISPTPWCVP